jgi:hypothetical protein
VGLEFNNKLRIFKVEKLPAELTEEFPPALSKVLGTRFYTTKEGTTLTLDRAYGEDIKTAFNLEITRLAQQIVETLKIMRAAGAGMLQYKGRIYLAETSYDVNTHWKNLDSELRKRDYKVTPGFALPSLEEDCLREVTSGLTDCCLSIHIIGSNPGMVPNGPSKKNIQVLQNELAVRQVSRRNLHRIVWLPRGTQSDDPGHQKFIEAMASDKDVQTGAELVDGDFETLKEAVIATLKKIEWGQTAQATAPAPVGSNMVLIVCEKRDKEAIGPLQQALKARGLQVRKPFFEGPASDIRKQNEELLRTCNAAIVFYGAGNVKWYVSNCLQVKKVNPGVPVWTYIAPESSPHKQEMLEQDDPLIINSLDAQLEGKAIEHLVSTSQKMHAAAGGPA